MNRLVKMKVAIVFLGVLAFCYAETYDDSEQIVRRYDALFERATCADEYLKLGEQEGKTHTMCKYTKVTTGSVSSADITVIIDKHNQLRSDPKTTQTASAMCKVYWDPNIAKIAQYFADACPTYSSGHDKLRDVPGYGISVGQNLVWGYGSWDAAIQGWFNEVKYFKFGTGSTTNGKAVGHYTQLVKDTTCRIGCGFAQCGSAKTYVCNYATGQQNSHTPFVTGSPCASCPNKCSNNLCDCGGKLCYNLGELDYNTCTCKCRSPYSGDSCQTLTCSGPDKSSCGKDQPNGYPTSFCTKYWNVPFECPVMCGTCKADGSTGKYYHPAPAAQLIAGSSGTATSSSAGNAQKGTPSNTGSNGSNSGSGGKKCSADRDFCTSWVKQEWCDWGENMKLTYNGEKGTPYSFCPQKCGQC